jgi:hypothetical protein
MEQTATYTLRPVQEADEALLLELYSSTRADEMALVPWDAAQKQAFLQMQFSAQQMHYRNYFPHATHDVIVTDGQPVGRLYVDRRDPKPVFWMLRCCHRRAHTASGRKSSWI